MIPQLQKGGGLKFFQVFRAFLISPFYSEHFEYTQVGWNLLIPFLRNEKKGHSGICTTEAAKATSKQQCKTQGNCLHQAICKHTYLLSAPSIMKYGYVVQQVVLMIDLRTDTPSKGTPWEKEGEIWGENRNMCWVKMKDLN